ncbi:MAG: CRTAC1 family protein [Acidobacteriota bacterium]
MSDEKKRPGDVDPEIDIENDEIIGVAFRRSMQVLAAVAILAAVGFGVWRLIQSGDQEVETTLERSAPEKMTAPAAAVGPPPLPFVDVTADVGIDFVHENGAAGDKLLPETMGSGAAFFDADRDGDPDLLLVNGRPWDPKAPASSSVFYRNDGDGTFTDATAEAGLETDYYGSGVAVGDFDADGQLDVFVTAVGENRLYRNLGGRFEDVTATTGVGGDASEWSTSAAFADFDGDGDLDLFIGNYVRWSPEIDAQVDYRLTGVGRAYGPPVNYQGTFCVLYRNEGDGTFTDVSAEAGIRIRNDATEVPVAKALGLAPIDVDGDGLMDLMVANDTVRNFLFRNLGDGTFEEVGEFSGLAYGRAGEATGAMGIDSGYFRNDPDFGFVIGNFANEMSSLYASQGGKASLFVDESITEGLGAPTRTFLTFGVLLFDADLDGRLDILHTNGHLENEISSVDPSQSYEQRSQLFWNAGLDARSTFVEVDAAETGDLAIPLVGRASAYADIDGDGDLDVVLTQAGRRPLLLRNDQDTGHRWLRLRLSDPGSANPDAVGAWVEVATDRGSQRRQVMPTRSYLSQSEHALTFGLANGATVESITVRWPDGSEQLLEPSLELDREHPVTRR